MNKQTSATLSNNYNKLKKMKEMKKILFIAFMLLSTVVFGQARLGYTSEEVLKAEHPTEADVKLTPDGNVMLIFEYSDIVTMHTFVQDICLNSFIFPNSKKELDKLTTFYNNNYEKISTNKWRVREKGVKSVAIIEFKKAEDVTYFTWSYEERH
jgi:hypothetical protein